MTTSTAATHTQSVPRFDNIPYADLSPEKSWTRLGKGSFGSVYKGEYLGIQVAIKEIMSSDEYDVQKYLQRECRILAEARHPNIVQYLGLCLADSPPLSTQTRASVPQRILIIMEYLPRGNLRQYIEDKSLAFPWRLRISFAVDAARALAYLHSRGAMHRDLKPENMLVTDNERIKLCDFGFARIAARNEEEMRRMSYCGTDGYMCPEILLGDEFGLACDVFSLGVIFCELASRHLADSRTFARQMPSFGLDSSEILTRANPGCPAEFLELALACVNVDPKKRPGVVKYVLPALRAIEACVLEAEAAALAKVTGLTRDATGLALNGGGSWNIGSVSFSGTQKLGATTRTGDRGGKARPNPPRLPSFEGRVTVGSSRLQHGRRNSGASVESEEGDEDEDDDDGLALLKVANIDIDGNSHAHRTALSDISNFDDEDDQAGRYSVAVLGRKGSAFRRPEAKGGVKGGATDSAVTVRGGAHTRLPSSASSLPSIPDSWMATSLGQSNGEQQAALSSMTEHTATLSLTNAIIAHDQGHARPSLDVPQDVFHSTLLASEAQLAQARTGPEPIHNVPSPLTLHRFSLIKPSFQRFFLFGNAAVSSSTAAAVTTTGHVTSNPMSPSASARDKDPNRCGTCARKLGLIKAYLVCDDCGYPCHIKCSDACPPGCTPHAKQVGFGDHEAGVGLLHPSAALTRT